MSRILGGPFTKGVSEILDARNKLLSIQSGREDSQLVYLNSNHSWIKLSSAVNTEDGNDLAKNNVLLGGTLYNQTIRQGFRPGQDLDGSYEINPEFGFVPMPGLDSLVVQSKNVFGSIKAASVEFKANSPTQLSNLESLFLRPGFSILVEWGNSHYVDKDGNISSVIETVGDDIYFKGNDPVEIQNKIEELKAGQSYAYDGMFGTIKNFTWSYAKNGEYDCKVDIISKGELVESIKSLIFVNTDKDEAAEEGDRSQIGTSLEELLEEIKNYRKESEFIPTKSKELHDKIVEETGELKIISHKVDAKENTEINKFFYLPLSQILSAINQSLMIRSTDNKHIVKFKTVKGEDDTQPYVTFPEHFMLDPEIGFLPGKAYSFQGEENPSDSMLDINVNIDLVLSLLDGFKNSSDKEKTTVFHLVKSILNNLNENAGGVNNFDIHYEDSNFTYYVVDRDLPPEATEIDVIGLGSSVLDLSLGSKLSNRIASFVAVAAQVSRTDVGEEMLSMQKWNDGLIDRFYPTKFIRDEKIPVSTEETTNTVLEEFKKDIEKDDNETYVEGSKSMKSLKATHTKQTVAALIKYKTDRKEPLPGIIPLELNIELKGISGLKVGQGLKISNEILPERYKEITGFIITGIEHQFTENSWTTKLTSQMFIIHKN